MSRAAILVVPVMLLPVMRLAVTWVVPETAIPEFRAKFLQAVHQEGVVYGKSKAMKHQMSLATIFQKKTPQRKKRQQKASVEYAINSVYEKARRLTGIALMKTKYISYLLATS
jgi:hypothetical protein